MKTPRQPLIVKVRELPGSERLPWYGQTRPDLAPFIQPPFPDQPEIDADLTSLEMPCV
jgi:hypothetical protein